MRVAGCVYVCDRMHACFGARSAHTGRTKKEPDQTITAGESHAFLRDRQLRLDVWDHVSRLREGGPGARNHAVAPGPLCSEGGLGIRRGLVFLI